MDAHHENNILGQENRTDYDSRKLNDFNKAVLLYNDLMCVTGLRHPDKAFMVIILGSLRYQSCVPHMD